MKGRLALLKIPMLTKLFVGENTAFATQGNELFLVLDFAVNPIDNTECGCDTL